MLVVGLKLNVDTNLCEESEVSDYLKGTTIELDPDMDIDLDKNPAKAEHYSPRTGEIVFHFAFPVPQEVFHDFFTDSELVYKIQN